MKPEENTDESDPVFSDGFVEELKKRWGGRPKYECPPLYRLATKPEWSRERTKVEGLLSLIPEWARPTVFKMLRSPAQFQTTFNTLIIGDQLKKCGLDPEYEKRINDQKPDWYAWSQNGIIDFAVEVTTLMAPEWFEKQTRTWLEFIARLEMIKLNYNVLIKCPNTEALVGKALKPIVGFVKNRLESILDPAIGSIHEFTYSDETLRIAFEAVAKEPQDGHVIIPLSPFLMQWVNAEYLRETISKKLTKYKFSKEDHIPLVIAVVPMFDSSIEVDNLVDIMFSNYSTDEEGAITVKRENLGRLALYTRLSAVMIVKNAWNPNTKIVHNPLAAHPISPSIFRGLKNLVVVHETEESVTLKWVTP